MNLSVVLRMMLLVGLVFNSTPVAAQTTSDWLMDKQGSLGDILGAEVIQARSLDEIRVVDVIIPHSSTLNFETVVVEERTRERAIKLAKKPELLHDDNGQPYGLRFHFKRAPNFQFRLHFYERPDLPQ